jgi:hypothetical protein
LVGTTQPRSAKNESLRKTCARWPDTGKFALANLTMKTTPITLLSLAALTSALSATEFHVATNGDDAQRGTQAAPLRTLQQAADIAQPGDVITVHAGTYRERVTPPRGGTSDTQRIVYRAAPGELVEVKGSEVVKDWVKVQGAVWKVTLPNSYFGSFNPYTNLIRGDWFDRRGRDHHTGAVYLDGDWLTEAAKLEEVLLPAGLAPSWLTRGASQYLLNVAWLRPGDGSGNTPKLPATSFTHKRGTQNAPCAEGGECLGFIAAGDWVSYAPVDFGQRTEQIEIRAAAEAEGGIIELRLDTPEGELLGSCVVSNTGGWQSWASFKTKLKPVSGSKTLCLSFKGLKPAALNPQLWFAQVDATNTSIWAQFNGVNPNERLVEINVRPTVFYPDQPGRNYLTVRGFTLRHAATPWAPPTAEQVGLIGTHWSQGWLIESNVISHSVCSGIALGKHGDAYDNTSADTAEGYVKTIERAHAHPLAWTKANIGHHVVRYNTISHCEQTGIVGSLGCSFSTVTGNIIHDIHVRRLFSGAEMAGIKFHGAIDTVIRGNHIYRTCRGLWLDWMAQGTRVSENLFHENASEDLMVEVNHGPFMVDNNLFLSAVNVLDMSQGGAYAHNLFTGKITNRPEPSRETPYHPAHSTKVAGLVNTTGGDDRFYNNIFVGNGAASAAGRRPTGKNLEWISSFGLWGYDTRDLPLQTGGNVFYHGAQPWGKATNDLVLAGSNPQVKLVSMGEQFRLELRLGPEWQQANTAIVTTALLGKAKIPGLPYENADGSPLLIGTDYFGKPRHPAKPTPGPFENPGTGPLTLRVW